MHTIPRNLRLLAWIALASGFALANYLDAQEPGEEAGQGTQEAGRTYKARAADGQRHGVPVEALAVAPGTRFLVTLEQDMNTRVVRQNQEFRVRTVEPLEAG